MVNKICDKVKEWRKEQGYSLQLLADCLGVSRDTITRFEEGHISAFNLEHLSILCSKEAEINVGINPTYEKKGYKSTKTGYIIPMMDCELGYLLGEEGYENRTRTKTDICKATGLSEVAVSALENLKRFIDDTTSFDEIGCDDEKTTVVANILLEHEKQKRLLLLETIEKLLISKQSGRVVEMLSSAFDTKDVYQATMKRIEAYKNTDQTLIEKQPTSILDAWSVIENEGLCILPSDKAEEYFINEASLAFREILNEMLSTEKER